MSDKPGAKAKSAVRPQEECKRQNIASEQGQVHFSDAPNGLLGMAAELANLFGSFEILSGDPTNFSLRLCVIRAAQNIAAQIKNAHARLNGVEYGLNTSVQKDVVRANYHLHDVAAFNEQIIDTLAVGGSVEAWRDQRARCLDALSCCANLCATPQPNGSLNVSIDGVTMVAGAEKPDCLATYPDPRGSLRIQSQNTGAPLKIICGSIARKMEARDGRLAELQGGLNTLAAQLITRVNSIYNTACELHGATGRDFFTGKDASNIGVNNILADDPAQLQTGAASEEIGTRMVALALSKLGSGKFFGPAKQAARRNPALSTPDLDDALAIVNDTFNLSRAASQQQALDSALDGETASFMRYQQACASSAKMITTLEKMSPMQ